MSSIAEKILTGGKMTDTDILIDPQFIEKPNELLPLQQSIAESIKNNALDLRSVFKAILFRNISPGLISSLLVDKNGAIYEDIYRFMRHNSFDKGYIMKKFNEQLSSTA